MTTEELLTAAHKVRDVTARDHPEALPLADRLVAAASLALDRELRRRP